MVEVAVGTELRARYSRLYALVSPTHKTGSRSALFIMMLDELTARVARRLRGPLAPYGVSTDHVYRNLHGRKPYRENLAAFMKLREGSQRERDEFPLGKRWPCYGDRFDDAGTASGHYFHQDLYVAQLIHAALPVRHIDIGSRIDGFVAHVASFRTVDQIDIRPIRSSADNISFHTRDISTEDPSWDDSCDSLSCLHVIEHFGLGRYGGALDLQAWTRAWANMTRMVRPGGTIYLSTLIGPQRIEFDAHRVFAVPTIVDLIEAGCSILSVAYVDDAGELHRAVDPHGPEAINSFGCEFGCGIFEIRR